MIENVQDVDVLRAAASHFRRSCIYRSVKPQLVEELETQGWKVVRRNAKTVRMQTDKPSFQHFEDRVWTVLHSMGFNFMSGVGGAKLSVKTPNDNVTNQLDVVALDDDTALYVECRTAQVPKKAPKFAEDTAFLSSLRGPFAQAIAKAFPRVSPRKVASLYWSFNIVLSDNDLERAASQKIRLFDEDELKYYEALVGQIGQAARYQFLADIFQHTVIPGLELVVPAIQSKIGKLRCYCFSISPSDLLKISYVSHRSKGKPTDVDTYQRLLKKSRLVQIRDYISKDGFFPTNIVINLASKRGLRFDKAKVPDIKTSVKGDFGWLYLPPVYKSAWIIDGQHRLFAYAGHSKANTSTLSVLAFDELKPSEQAKLFVDINSKQKSVKQNLLMELYSELHWDSDDPLTRAKAVVSRTILALDGDVQSPLFERVLKADDKPDDLRCITLNSLSSALIKPEFFLGMHKGIVAPGAFWTADNFKTVRRAKKALNAWFKAVADEVPDVWSAGKGPGGAVAMNDGTTVIINVLRSLLRHLIDKGYSLFELTDDELIDKILPFGAALGEFFATLPTAALADFRKLRGIQGQTSGTHEAQAFLAHKFDDYKPSGLEDYLKLRAQHTSEQAQKIVNGIELLLHKYLLDTLKEKYGTDEAGWWFKGIPTKVRKKVDDLRNEEQSPSPRETKFYFIDFREIIEHNWPMFIDTLGKAKANVPKSKQTEWLVRINEIRNVADHPVKGPVSLEDLEYLKQEDDWLRHRLG